MKNQFVATFAPEIVSQVRNYGKLMRVDKPIGVWLLLWPTLWALWLAGEGTPDQGLFVIFVLGVFIMRSAGCVLNDFVDRKIDPYVERTRTRPLATGAVAPLEALTLFAAGADACRCRGGTDDRVSIHKALRIDSAVRARCGIRLGSTYGVRRADR